MGFTIFIGVLVFAGLMAILYFGYEQAEKDRAERAAAEALREHVHPPGRTADEVVFDLEHRIDSDLQDVAAMLRRAVAGPRRA
jgi:cbb3-type cytochrome oxidase subunit 3